jgi:hypothetical protein
MKNTSGLLAGRPKISIGEKTAAASVVASE